MTISFTDQTAYDLQIVPPTKTETSAQTVTRLALRAVELLPTQFNDEQEINVTITAKVGINVWANELDITSYNGMIDNGKRIRQLFDSPGLIWEKNLSPAYGWTSYVTEVNGVKLKAYDMNKPECLAVITEEEVTVDDADAIADAIAAAFPDGVPTKKTTKKTTTYDCSKV